jgi:hypothetical protein
MTERPHITSMSGRILSTVHRPDSGTVNTRTSQVVDIRSRLHGSTVGSDVSAEECGHSCTRLRTSTTSGAPWACLASQKLVRRSACRSCHARRLLRHSEDVGRWLCPPCPGMNRETGQLPWRGAPPSEGGQGDEWAAYVVLDTYDEDVTRDRLRGASPMATECP